MLVYLDGREEVYDAAKLKSVKEVFDFFKEKLRSREVFIYKVEVDGELKNLVEVSRIDLGKVKTVKFFTKPKEQFYKDALKEAAINLPELIKVILSVISALRKDEERSGLEEYLKAAPLLGSIALGLRSIEVGWGKEFNIDYLAFSTCIKNINDAYTNQDYMLLADALEFGLLPWLKSVADAILPRIK